MITVVTYPDIVFTVGIRAAAFWAFFAVCRYYLTNKSEYHCFPPMAFSAF
jgi:hypothetical protein